MNKTLKSVKVNNDLLKIIDEYASLLSSLSVGTPTFTAMIEEGICLYLLKQMKLLEIVMQNSVVVENGKLKEITVTDEQTKKIAKLTEAVVCYFGEDIL